MMNVTNDLRIRRFILAGIMLAVCLGLSFQGVGGGIPSLITAKQTGTFTATWSTATQTIVTGTVNFPAGSFTASPTITITPRAGAQINYIYLASTYSFFSLESTGQTWVNVPGAPTEIFGDTTHEISVDFINFGPAGHGNINWQIYCVQGSNSPTAFIRPEYLDLVSGTWKELAQSPGVQDVNVFACAQQLLLSAPPWDLAANAVLGQQSIAVRLTEFNGGGIGDTQTFVSASISLYPELTVTPICGENTTPALSSFSWRCSIVAPLGMFAPQSITVDWQAEQK